MPSVKNYLFNLNLFESSDDTSDQVDEHQRHSNIISTRVYLVTFVLALATITIVSSLRSQTTIVTMEYPGKSQFDALPFNAHCPCARISIPYGELTSIQSAFHQVCSSDFVRDRWIEAIFSGSNSTYFHMTDFRTYGSALFQALASFCRLSKASVDQIISSFYTTSLLSTQLQTEADFQLQVEASISKFQLTAPHQFVKQLELVRQMMMANSLISGLQTNVILTYPIEPLAEYYIIMSDIIYQLDNGSTCVCGANIDCATRSQIMKSFGNSTQMDLTIDSEVLMDIPGLVVSCVPVNSLLLSTLECFYNQTCLDELLSFFPTNENFNAMVASKKSRFTYDSTVETIVSELMIEEWYTNISYEKYAAQCAPILCTYSKLERPNALFVLAQLIRSLGGLTLIFGFLISMIVRFIRRPRNVETTPCKCYALFITSYLLRFVHCAY